MPRSRSVETIVKVGERNTTVVWPVFSIALLTEGLAQANAFSFVSARQAPDGRQFGGGGEGSLQRLFALIKKNACLIAGYFGCS